MLRVGPTTQPFRPRTEVASNGHLLFSKHFDLTLRESLREGSAW